MAHGTATLHDAHGSSSDTRFLHGVVAEYRGADDLLRGAKAAWQAGYRKLDAYTPFAVEGIDEYLGHRDYIIPWTMFVAGITGTIAGFSLVYYTRVLAYPLNIGSRPPFSWPYYIPIAFETTVLFAALAGVAGLFVYNGLPEPYHPVFDAPDFARASSDRFFLCIEATDDEHGTFTRVTDRGKQKVDRDEVRRFLESTPALRVTEVERRK